MPRSSVLAVAACLLLLTACGGGDDSADPASTTADGAPADVCAELANAGYTGADLGPVATWESPDVVQERVDHLSAIADVPAPEGPSAAWEVRLGYVDRLRTMLDDSGAALDPAAAMATEQEDAAAETLTDWWFDTCR